MRLRTAALCLLLLIAPRLAPAQVGSTTDIITGTVRNADDRPVANARIEVMSVETGITRMRTTNEKGQYTLLFPDGGGQYSVTARAIGLLPATVSLIRLADEDRLVVDFRLSPTVLSTVTVSARQTPRSNENQATPGSTERALTGEQLLRLPIDASDPNAIAALSPGVVGMLGTDSTAAGFSVAGQRADQNLVTLDGLTFGGAIPAEAVRNTRVITSTFDIARGQFTGGQVASTTRGGTNDISGSVAYALRDPSLEFATGDEATSFSGAYTQHQLSGGVGGALVKNKTFWFASMQVRRRLDALQSLLGAGTQTLEALNVQPDSAARFLSLLTRYGLPLHNSLVPDDRTNDNLTGIVRLDQQLSEGHSLSVRGNVSGTLLDGFRSSAQSVPTHAGEQKQGGAGGLISMSSVVGQFLNEFKGSYNVDSRGANPYLRLPEGRVLVGSTLSNGQVAITGLDFGGNGALPNDSRTSQTELTDELSWLSGGGKHRWKLGGLINRSGFRTTAGSNRSGNFQFLSLADLDANRPSQFSRSFAPAQRTGGAVTAAVYFGDIWRPNRTFQLTYGARGEGSAIDGQPRFNPDVAAKFGLRTDRIPTDMRISPRIGFTLTLGLPPDTGRRGNRNAAAAGAGAESGRRGGGGAPGGAVGGGAPGGGRPGGGGLAGLLGSVARNAPAPQIPQPWIVRGGLGDFRGRAPTQLFSSALDATGLPGAETQLVCVGGAVPTPDWASYLHDFGSIPTVCADGSGPSVPLSRTRPNVTAFDPDFQTPRSVRGSLGVSKRFRQRYNASVDASYSLGTSLYGVSDLNLVETPQFTLAREGNRPVFVPASTIVPHSGVTTLAASRVHPEYGYVFKVASPLASHTTQVTASLNGNSFRQLVWNVSYTFTRSTDQSSFSGGSAAGGFSSPTTNGDPNIIRVTTSDLERRHGLTGSLTWLARPWLDITSILRLQSGSPYTPRVGGDINGDGSRNDRAYIFDPATSTDTALAAGMSRLLATAPGAARDCLRAQLGRIADRNSCRTAWATSLDLQLNLRPQLGPTIGRRLQLQVGLVNPLAGLDQLAHGTDHLRGWGQPTFADNTLLYVRGFDPSAKAFRYVVNERFGSNALARSALRNPFQISLTARLQVGVDRQRQLLERMLRAGATNRPGLDVRAMVRRLAPNPIVPLRDLKTELKLTAAQLKSLAAIGDSLDSKTAALTKRLEAQVAAEAKSGGDLQTLFPKLQPLLQEARNNYVDATKSIQSVLTAEQWAEVPESVKNPTLRPAGAGAGQGRRTP
ncbi:MAG: carboxypeptidase regulatory-like domain-containing protein [Gemmatimonadetes bacterium]|nr:carboxypeptidase regulatory-like domain-containing protein [Gemmatimonadota bacterium]